MVLVPLVILVTNEDDRRQLAVTHLRMLMHKLRGSRAVGRRTISSRSASACKNGKSVRSLPAEQRKDIHMLPAREVVSMFTK